MNRLLCSVLTLLGFCACNKNSEESPPPACTIASIKEGNATYGFTFDAQGRVLTKISPGDPYWYPDYSYSWSHTSCELLVQRDNRLWKRTTAELNERGLPNESLTVSYSYLANNPTPYPGDSVRNTFEYDNEGHLTKIISNMLNGPQAVHTFTWSNGNLVSDSRGFNYTYDLTQPGEPGDFLNVMQLWPDAQDVDPRLVVMKSRNLLKSITVSGNTLVINYEKNAEGNIVGINNQVMVTYNCN